jgi:hypothetical protein
VVNVHDYGATGNGAADDTDAIAAAFKAARCAGVPVLFPAVRYRIHAPLPLESDMCLVGGRAHWPVSGEQGAEIVSMSTSVIRPSGTDLERLRLLRLALTADTAGVDLIDLTHGGLAGSVFDHCVLLHTRADGCLIRCAGKRCQGNLFRGGAMLAEGGADARRMAPLSVTDAIPPADGNVLRDVSLRGGGAAMTPFVRLEGAPGPDRIGGWTLANVVAQNCPGGLIHAFAVLGLSLCNVEARDVAIWRDDVFRVGGSYGATLVGCRRMGGAMASGKYVINLDGSTGCVIVGSVCDRPGSATADLNLGPNTKLGF